MGALRARPAVPAHEAAQRLPDQRAAGRAGPGAEARAALEVTLAEPLEVAVEGGEPRADGGRADVPCDDLVDHPAGHVRGRRPPSVLRGAEAGEGLPDLLVAGQRERAVAVDPARGDLEVERDQVADRRRDDLGLAAPHCPAGRQPAARASASLQNQRSPLASLIFVRSYQRPPGTW